MIQAKRLRFRWRRTLAVVLAGYFAVWIGISCWHMVLLWHDQQQWNQKIALAKQEQGQLRADVRQLENPNALKGMIQGQRPIPDPAVSSP